MIQGISDIHLAALRNWAASLRSVEAVYAFGSRARGDANDASDLDLAVVSPHRRARPGQVQFTPLGESDRKSLVESLALPFAVQMETTHPNAGDQIVWPAVVEHGVLLSGKDFR